MSDIMRITGMASGLDVDSMVKSMMKAENIRLDTVKQNRQIVQWKQDTYREILMDINTFKSTYFDVTKPDSNMLSSNNYAGFDVTTSDGGTTSSTIVGASAGAGASTGTYSVKVTQIAKASVIEGTPLTDKLRTTKLSELGVNESTTMQLTYNNDGTSKTVKVNIDSNSTIGGVMNAISSATSGEVSAQYSELTGKFTIQTANKGGTRTLKLDSGSDKLLSALGLTAGTVGTDGQDAKVEITPPGAAISTTVTKSTNNFTIDGMTYNLLKEDGSTATIKVTPNVQKTYDKIKAFIDKYNETIENIQTKLDEKKNTNFKPLTEDQKKDMKEEDIKKWEDKAKEGLLKGDSQLQSMLYSLRRGLYDSVKDAGITLSEAGFSTDSDYSQGGKIIINETKLKDAILNHGGQVASLFMKDSSIAYDPDHKTDSDRHGQIGIFQRINDTLMDYTRTIRDSNNKKGTLIEKAGIKGDMSEFNNTLSNDLKNNYDKRISDLVKKLSDKENKYYNQFSRLEVAMQKLNDQSSWLSQMLGTSSSS